MATRTETLYATKNGAYVYKSIMLGGKPTGLLWHSTGVDNPWVQRYAGDSATSIPLIGANPNNNGFQQTTNNQGFNAKGESIPCPNAVMGLGTDGKMLTVKILPDDYCPWCSGGGNLATAQANGFKGNNANFLGFYQLEVCEDQSCTSTIYGRKNPHTPRQYADLCYNEMVSFSIDFFKEYFNGDSAKVTPKTLLGHIEGYKMGIASNHTDPWHWLGKYGYNGDTFRNAVKAGLQNGGSVTPPTPPTPPPPIGTTKYTCVKGDTISGIAGKFGITTAELIAANPQIKNPNLIYVGQVINIPAKDGGGNPGPTEPPEPPKKTVEEVAWEIWRGQGGWGNDPGRKEKLITYGGVQFRNDVQRRINEIIASGGK